MIVTRLETHHFRNLVGPVVVPHPRFNLLSGQNAQGKTNFLEAVHVLAAQQSFRASRTAEMIRFGHDAAAIDGCVESAGLTRELRVVLLPTGRRVLVDGKPARGAASALRAIAAVLFSPDDLQVPRGAPADRRRLLDRAIATVWPAYNALLRDYGKTLASRNKLLREQPATLARLLDVYDDQLAALGAKVVAARQRYLQALGPMFRENFDRIAQTGVTGELRYLSDDETREAAGVVPELGRLLLSRLQRHRSQDLARRKTSVGPHTDDIEFLLDGQPARHYGSQGQVRGLVLAFRIAEILDTHQKLGDYPVLLLDDVSSELDPARNSYLFDFIDTIDCQVFVTTTRPELIPLPEKHFIFHVVAGEVRR